jgi:D-alanyl-D-alanine carboxypeptidase (penicillin-binding protein 5/6)
MKKQTSHDQANKPQSHPARHVLAAMLAMGAFFFLGSWGCSMFARPDSHVEPGLRKNSSIASPMPVARNSSGAPEIHAKSAIMIDALSGETLYEKNADLTLPVASTQKLLTALEVINEGGLEEEVTVSFMDAMEPPTKVGLQPGTAVKRIDLLGSMLVASANDAASVLASNGQGSREAFLKNMNALAKRLGAKNSRFMNAHGLDEPGQYSTARDSAIIAYHAYRNPLIRYFAAQQFWTFGSGYGDSMILENTNDLLWNWPPYFNGLKGGFTFSGGKCLVASAKHNGSEIIIILLGSTPQKIFRDTKRLFQWHHDRQKSAGHDGVF